MDVQSHFNNLLVQTANEAGFPLASTIDLDSVLDGEFQKHIERYDQWLASGYAGEMAYLIRGRDRRANPRLVFPQAQSMLCVALPYHKLPVGGETPAEGPRYARYLKGEDYHASLALRLEAVMQKVQAALPAEAGQEAAKLEWKVCVDTSAILERSWAALAGLGWIGKNTLLIHPQYGSYLFLAEVLINQKTGQGPKLLPNYCGNCSRCLNACPTQAFTSTGALNSNRCVSYWTLEKRGELHLSEEDKKKMGTWIAGCDRCQEVCPFNTKPVRAAEKASPPNSPAPSAIDLQDWQGLWNETEEAYKVRVKNSALARVKPAQFRRNLEIAFKNKYLT